MDWEKAILYAQLVNEAYAPEPNDLRNRGGQVVSAGRGAAATTFDILTTIYANDLATQASKERGDAVKTVSIGLLLQAQGSGDVVVAIRGTVGIREWVEDAQFNTEEFTRVAAAGRTEDGFTDTYDSMTIGSGPQDIPGTVKLAGGLEKFWGWKRPVTSLTICGHSLGGALATLFALDVAANTLAPFKTPVVYTYASPKTGDQDFRGKYQELVATTYRLVDNVDIVPKGPPEPEYLHVCDGIIMKSLQLLPPRVRLQPNPVCWHILTSYLCLMSLASGGAHIKPEGKCRPDALIKDIIAHIRAVFRTRKSLAKDFRYSDRWNLDPGSCEYEHGGAQAR